MIVGVLQICNVRHALKTGTIAVGIRDTSRVREFNRKKNPLLFHLNFWPCLIAAIALPLMGIGFIGAAVFFLTNP